MDCSETIERFLELFPEKKPAYIEHMEMFGALLQHPFYYENINVPLQKLLADQTDTALIRKYCAFIERMIQDGDEAVKNVADVTVLECLSDDRTLWHRFATYISDDLIRYINTRLLHENTAMYGVDQLAYNGRNHKNG